MTGTLKSTALLPLPSQLSAKQRYGSSLRMSRFTPADRAIGPVRLQAIASSSRDRADALRAVDEDAVLVQQLRDVVGGLGHLLVDEVLHHPHEGALVRQVHVQPADARPAGVETLAGHELDDVVDDFALVEAVEERGERAEVEPRRADAQQVRLNATEFAGDRAQHFACAA